MQSRYRLVRQLSASVAYVKTLAYTIGALQGCMPVYRM